jgi:drug/metabolite transporter (DMT)-like permease
MNWVIQSFLALFSIGVMVVLITDQLRKGMSVQFLMFLIAVVFWAPAYGVWAWRKGFNYHLSASTIAILFVIGALSVFGNWAQFEAAAKAPNPGIAFAIVGCQAVVITILAKFFLGNNVSLAQWGGIALCIVGIMLINIGR